MDYLFIKSKRNGKEEYGSVYARVRAGGKNKKYTLGITIKESEWLKYKSLKFQSSAIITSIGVRYGDFVNILTQIKHALEEDFDPDNASAVIHSIIFSSLNKTEVEVPAEIIEGTTLLRDYMASYIEELRSGARMKRRQTVKVSEGYCINLHSTLTRLKQYETQVKKRFTLDEITMKFQKGFIKFLHDIGIKQNTVSSHMSTIHAVMNVAYFEKKTSNIDFKHPNFVPLKEDTDEIFLTQEQVDQIIEMDISSVDSLKKLIKNAKFSKERKKTIPHPTVQFFHYVQYVRDVFVVGCLTGQRFSDYSRINEDMITIINEKQFIKLTQKKTGTTVYIPYDPRVKRILESYGGKLPSVTRRAFNRDIRFIGELLGWTHKAILDNTDEEHAKRFCDMISSHTARRTFATNAYSAGVPIPSIIAVTGHSSEKNLKTYLRLNRQEKAVIAASDFKDFMQH